jgi:rubrerythrin
MKGEGTMATMDNLQAAFAGESQANRKYLAFAKKAQQDGYPNIARLFRAAAEAETVHAHSHLRVMGGIKATPENVAAAVSGEGYEFKEMYPAFLAEAEKEGKSGAAISFKNALAVERIHHALYSEAAASLTTGKDLSARRIFVCPVCGNTVYDSTPDKCAICNTAGKAFVEIQ